MAEVTAALIKELREKSGAGMLDCKKALAENGGDIEAAVDWLRKKGLAAAAKKAGRVAGPRQDRRAGGARVRRRSGEAAGARQAARDACRGGRAPVARRREPRSGGDQARARGLDRAGEERPEERGQARRDHRQDDRRPPQQVLR